MSTRHRVAGRRTVGSRYEVVRQLGEGGMGVILEAEHVLLNERFAVKMLSPLFASDQDVFARFRREAAVTARMDHPHIVKVIDFDMTDPDDAYLVLELLRGETLRDRLTRGPVRPEDAVRIVAQLASALSAVHSAGIVHRDVKPSNVFLVDGEEEGPFVKLLDFGVCKELRPVAQRSHLRFLVGTPDYMAPEQASGRSEGVDARTDQHALALVAYEMLTGHPPFAHGDLSEVLRRVATLEPAPASSIASALPTAIDAVLARALSKDPGERFEDVGAFAGALAMAFETGELPAASAARPETTAKDGVPCAPTLPSVVPAPQPMERAARSGAVSVRHSAATAPRADGAPSEELSRRSAISATATATSGAQSVNAVRSLHTPDSSRVEALRNLAHLVSMGAVRAGCEGAPC